MKPLVYTKEEWQPIWDRIQTEYPPSIVISWVCKRELGFTIREHSTWVSDNGHWWDPRKEIHLDFYDEQMKTLFILRYK